MVNNNGIPIEVKKPFETVYEIKNETPSFEEFMEGYENDGSLNYSDLNSSGLGTQEGCGPCIPYNPNCKCSAEQLREQLRSQHNRRFNVKISLAGDGNDGFSSFGDEAQAGAWMEFTTENSFYSIYYESEGNRWKRNEPFLFGKTSWETKTLVAKDIMTAEKFIDGLDRSGKNGIWVEGTGVVLGYGNEVTNLSYDSSSCREKRQKALNLLKEAVVEWNRGGTVDVFHDIRPRANWQ